MGPADSSKGYTIVSSCPHAGKTVVAGGLARRFSRAGRRVGVFVPVAYNCRRGGREGLASADAEFLAHCSDCRADMPTICPVRFGELILPGDYSTISRPEVDMELITESWQRLRGGHELMIVQAPAGIYHPLSDKLKVIDLLANLALPVIVVGPASCQAVSTLVLTIESLRSHGLGVEAVVLNRYDPLQASAEEEICPEALAALAEVPLPVVIPPDDKLDTDAGILGDDVIFAIEQVKL